MKWLKNSNFSAKEQKALMELQSRDDMVNTVADKGGAVVILDVKYYIKEVKRQFHNTQVYRWLNCDPTTTNNETIDNVI